MNRKTYYSLMPMIFCFVQAHQISIKMAVEPNKSIISILFNLVFDRKQIATAL
jgi:hypothetical protein